MEGSHNWAQLEAALKLIGELQRGEPAQPATPFAPETPQLLNQHGDPLPPSTPPTLGAPAQEQDTVVDVFGKPIDASALAGMRDSKGRPIVIPR